MNLLVSTSDIIAIMALALSGYAAWTTSKFNRRQLSLIDSQEKLNRQQLEQAAKQALEACKADIGASLIDMGNHSHRVRVFNRGRAPARMVRIEFPNGDDIISESDVADKFPMEILEQDQFVDIIASIYLSTESKQAIILRWADDYAEENEKTVYLTF